MTKDDKKFCCPLCNYFEVWDKDDNTPFFYWRNESCRKWTWLVCNDSFNYPRNLWSLTKQEREALNRGEGQQAHIIWAEYKQYVDKINSIWENQNQRICPEWGDGGRKDGNCTNVVCARGHPFCYFWGISFKNINKSNHNNINKCYLIIK